MNATIKNGDALQLMKELSDESIDAIITDPPYQLVSIKKRFGKPNSAEAQFGTDGAIKRVSKGFMGKTWDVLPSVETLKEALRVLKSGAFALWLMTPRQDSQLEFLLRLRQAGFVIGFTPLYWAYASGFPKSENISLAIDKQSCKEEYVAKFGKIKTKEDRKSFNRYWKEWQIKGERKKLNPRDKKAYTPNSFKGLLGTQTFQGNENMFYEKEPKTEQAKALNGSYAGFQPKPAVEVVIVSMKPLSEKTYADQALKNGKGITWFDNVRIPYKNADEYVAERRGTLNSSSESRWGYRELTTIGSPKGRFPANLLASDNALDTGLKRSIGHSPNIKTTGYGSFGGGKSERINRPDIHIKDDGDFSRYFSLDEWYRANIEKLPKEQQKTMPFLIVPKASKSEKNKGLGNLEIKPIDFDSQTRTNKETADKFGAERKSKAQNFHPTVKPIKLMSYLIILTTREGDTVLDPFMGSGTTGVACKMLNRNFVGFELDPEYYKIAEARINSNV